MIKYGSGDEAIRSSLTELSDLVSRVEAFERTLTAGAPGIARATVERDAASAKRLFDAQVASLSTIISDVRRDNRAIPD